MTSKFDKLDAKLREQYEDAFFQELMEGYDEYQGAKLKREAEAENNGGPSPELIAQMKGKISKEISRQKRMNAIWKMRRFGKYVAVFLVMIVTIFSVSFVSVDAFRTRILNFFAIDHGESTIHVIQPDQDGTLAPSYIPAGMDIVLYSDENSPIQIVLQSNDADSYANIFIYDGRTKVHSDTENALVLEHVLINGMEGEYCKKDEHASLTWCNNDGSLIAQMTANISKEDMILIAQSIAL